MLILIYLSLCVEYMDMVSSRRSDTSPPTAATSRCAPETDRKALNGRAVLTPKRSLLMVIINGAIECRTLAGSKRDGLQT